jgi:hypothetical protein
VEQSILPQYQHFFSNSLSFFENCWTWKIFHTDQAFCKHFILENILIPPPSLYNGALPEITNKLQNLTQQLQIEFGRFLILLESRKKAFTNTHVWENYDNYEEITSSSSDSEQLFKLRRYYRGKKKRCVVLR